MMGMATLSLLVIFCFIRGVMPAADLKIFYLYVSKYLLFVTIKRAYEGRTDTVQDKYKNINKLKIYRNVFLFSEIYTENLLAIMQHNPI